MRYRSAKNRASSEGLKSGKNTPIIMNGSGYLHPNQKKLDTIKALPKPDTMRHMGMPNKIGGRITDCSKLSKLCPLDHKLRNLF